MTPSFTGNTLRNPTFGEDEELYAEGLCREDPDLSPDHARAHARLHFMLWRLGHAQSVIDFKPIIERLITGT